MGRVKHSKRRYKHLKVGSPTMQLVVAPPQAAVTLPIGLKLQLLRAQSEVKQHADALRQLRRMSPRDESKIAVASKELRQTYRDLVKLTCTNKAAARALTSSA